MKLFQWLRARLFGPSNNGRTKNLPNSSSSSSASKPDETKKPESKPRESTRQFPETIRQTPNVSARSIRPEVVVFHHTDGSYNGSVAWCCDPKSKVSYHCIIARDGRRTVLARPTQRAWHAGKSSYKGRSDVNSFSVGIAFEGNTYLDPLEPEAIESCLEYVIPLMQSYGIRKGEVTDHRSIAPSRKIDIEPYQLASLKWRIEKALDG